MDAINGLTEKEFALQTLERYSGSNPSLFRSKLLLTNFPQYVKEFSKKTGATIYEGSMFKVAHDEKTDVSIIDFKIGSPAAALVVQLCSFLPLACCLLLGMCGGLRRRYKIGDYLVPVASIRKEGTSDHFLLPEIPALGNFLMQRACTHILDQKKEAIYHIGITYSTNIRFWEFNETFREYLRETKAQGIEMECATLFAAAYKYKLTLGALLLISDLPLDPQGLKTRDRSEHNFENYMSTHIDHGIEILMQAEKLRTEGAKGSYRKMGPMGLGVPKKIQ